MHRKFIFIIVSAAIAIAGFSAPVRADSGDIAKVFAGIAALALIGKALEDDKDQKTVTRHTYHTHTYNTPRSQTIRPKPVPQRFSRYDLPGQCLRSYAVNRQHVRLFGAGCLRNNYGYSHALPYACQFQFSNRTGSHTGYEPKCLRERGYRVTRY